MSRICLGTVFGGKRDPLPTEPASADEFTDIDAESTDVALEGYTIRVASRMTGLSVDTLRMWERRYGFPSPYRNAVGNRIYRESDVERLVLIARAMKVGYRAGEAIRLSVDELTDLLSTQAQNQQERQQTPEFGLAPLLDCISHGDLEGLRQGLRRRASNLGIRKFIIEVVGPLTEEIGQRWARGELQVHEEHLATEVLSTQLLLAASHLENPPGPGILLGTLPREQHAIGLQMVALFAQSLGLHVHLLGTDTPPLEFVRAAATLSPQVVGISLAAGYPPPAALDHIERIVEALPPSIELWLGGKGAASLEGLPSRVKVIRSWDEMELMTAGLHRGL